MLRSPENAQIEPNAMPRGADYVVRWVHSAPAIPGPHPDPLLMAFVRALARADARKEAALQKPKKGGRPRKRRLTGKGGKCPLPPSR